MGAGRIDGGLAHAMAAIVSGADQVPAVLVGRPRLLGPARDALAAIGGRELACLDWDEVGPDVVLPAAPALVVLEVRGAGDDLLAAALPLLVAAARAVDAPLVACFDRDAIDLVTASLFGSDVQLLCEPDAVELTVALALAARALGHAAIHDTTYEGEGERLRRLNEEVARIADALARLTRRDAADGQPGHDVSDRHATFGVEPAAPAIEATTIRRAIRARRMRDPFFGSGLFEEPGWDMILDLFAAELEHGRVSVSSLCIAAAVAPTTALRWISKLCDAGLFERRPDPVDRRRVFMKLSDRASLAMRGYLAALGRAGLSLA